MAYGRIHYRDENGEFQTADFDDYRELEVAGGGAYWQVRLAHSSDVALLGANFVGLCRGTPNGRERSLNGAELPAGCRVSHTLNDFAWTTPHWLLWSNGWGYAETCPFCSSGR